MIKPKHKAFLFLIAAFSLANCSDEINVNETEPAIDQDKNAIDSFRMGNAEIRQDIINALITDGIEHWENDDGSIGFYVKDAEKIDAIGYFAIGAYAARQ
ncbi:MAG: hypothetical protein VYE30_11015 [Pseudomonadota bacterium]|nr:hypothetical protein [Pseudomonadota bacterium]